MRARAVLVGVALTLGGCALSGGRTYSGHGRVGDVLKGPEGLTIRLLRFQPRVRGRADVTGGSAPRPGSHFAAVLVRECVRSVNLPTIGQQDYTLDLAGGGTAALKFPETVFSDDLNLLGAAGCQQGHMVFQVPSRGRPRRLRFALDKSENAPGGGTNDTHVRFSWRL